MLDDPQVNFAISDRARATDIDHLGIQVESRVKLSELAGRLKTAGASDGRPGGCELLLRQIRQELGQGSVRCELGDLLHLRRGDGLWRGHDSRTSAPLIRHLAYPNHSW